MSFENHSLGAFIEAKEATSRMLVENGSRSRGDLGFEEALIMQTAADILTERETFYGYEVKRVMNVSHLVLYKSLGRFVHDYGIAAVAKMDGDTTGHAKNRIPYEATDFGMTVFGLYAPSLLLER